MREAPSTFSAVTIWCGEEKVAQDLVDPSTTLREFLTKQTVLGSLDPETLRVSLFEDYGIYDASYARKLLGPSELDMTLEALGWFPSGVIELRSEAKREPTRTTFKASTLFNAVDRRFDDARPTDSGNPHFRAKKSGDTVMKSRGTVFAKVDAKRKAASSQTATKVWQILAKRHSMGQPNIRDDDRFHLVVVDEVDLGFYCFFGRATSVSAAVEGLKRWDLLGDVLISCETPLPMTATFAHLERSGLLHPFAIVQFKSRTDLTTTEAPTTTTKDEAMPPPPKEEVMVEEEEEEEETSKCFPVEIKFEEKVYSIRTVSEATGTVGDLREAIAKETGVPGSSQKLLCRDRLTDSECLLKDTKLRPGTTIVLVRSKDTTKKFR